MSKAESIPTIQGAKAARRPALQKLSLAPSPGAQGTTIVRLAPGDRLTVVVDVENVALPYMVIFDDRPLMYGLVDRRESSGPLSPGTYRLFWAFNHIEKGWSHRLSVEIPGGPAELLEARSEAHKDGPYTIGMALVVVG